MMLGDSFVLVFGFGPSTLFLLIIDNRAPLSSLTSCMVKPEAIMIWRRVSKNAIYEGDAVIEVCFPFMACGLKCMHIFKSFSFEC